MDYGPPSITRLYRNDIEEGRYLQVRLKGNASTLTAHGARIQVFSDSLFINQEIDGGNTSHLSHNSNIAHFGLGKREKIDSLKVIWPSGEVTNMTEIQTNQKILIEEKLKFKKKSDDLIWWIILLLMPLGLILFIRIKKNKH
jgi:hypothetical protein